ncbi:heptosyltransferase-1 [Amphritea atlantica]|jgi:heptosyltransferase-1|uniref:Lipopolysaccharide heptosyltransferase 1 n=1 Tax=Amphritea atlantica TaxID=355243 RepID=A0A1H9JYK1_9GAMM|nr:lipopolysaccharide heptosyltransferase I [Amphritea atlantica]SEQ91939.1 heptosyltransferase-1 [Amphritea atlantica]
MMKKILLVKMSSLGDLLHTMPAVTDALANIEGLKIDWLCEEPFVDIARLHPGVNVIPHGRLRWKKRRFALETLTEQYHFYKALRQTKYDLVIDAQGRIKSARVGWLSGAPVCGPDKYSATDPETRVFYKQGISTLSVTNAVDKVRLLFSRALDYELAGDACFGIEAGKLASCPENWQGKYVFFHGTTWQSKHWPEREWIRLLELAKKREKGVLLPWANEEERLRAERIVSQAGWGEILPKMSLWDLCGIIARSNGAVGVDTGLMHVAAAMGIPTVSVFGSTSVALTGAQGNNVTNLQAQYECSPCKEKCCPRLEEGEPPCYSSLPGDFVWQQLQNLISKQ